VVYWNRMDAWVPRPESWDEEEEEGPPLAPIFKLMTPTALVSTLVEGS
ncbi:MAG: hypothetical protein GWN82_10180, partial [Gemmatimonadetes bacterium]|nr:hypothetical protein [Gemmatimonadota bacterium]NIU31059.1 hypothetical protein [Gemmatimonadota bacterium]NIV61422.1 hypothetical protein [Gemmatimonadota bacterium]NIW64126.1 hypothetical protein [Gemmatimonadota bacterium]NIX39490.1 hypothetical protein [Gemmatimonadota bacterium]